MSVSSTKLQSEDAGRHNESEARSRHAARKATLLCRLRSERQHGIRSASTSDNSAQSSSWQQDAAGPPMPLLQGAQRESMIAGPAPGLSRWRQSINVASRKEHEVSQAAGGVAADCSSPPLGVATGCNNGRSAQHRQRCGHAILAKKFVRSRCVHDQTKQPLFVCAVQLCLHSTYTCPCAVITEAVWKCQSWLESVTDVPAAASHASAASDVVAPLPWDAPAAETADPKVRK